MSVRTDKFRELCSTKHTLKFDNSKAWSYRHKTCEYEFRTRFEKIVIIDMFCWLFYKYECRNCIQIFYDPKPHVTFH